MKDQALRFPAIDAFKAIAAQLIVLHHLAAYGPMSDAAQQALPGLISWLYDNARMSVQVFLVIGGYLAARSLAPSRLQAAGAFSNAIFNRYLRLAVPFLAAMLLSIVCAIAARHWMSDDFIPDAPSWPQLLAHALLLQSVLDFDALTAGAWYIAIDFQLFLLMAGIVWLGAKSGHARRLVPLLTTITAAASLLWFNRLPAMDNWAIYFFGAYGLGAAAYWASQRNLSRWLWLLALLATAALMLDFRPRIALALVVAMMLFLSSGSRLMDRVASQPGLQYLGRISYSLFLVHFPIVLLANTLFTSLELSSPGAAVAGMMAAWAISVLAADRFHRYIEQPSSQLKVGHLITLGRAEHFQRLRYLLAATTFWVLAIPV